MPGLLVVPQRFPIGRAIEELTMILLCSDHSEWRDLIIHCRYRSAQRKRETGTAISVSHFRRCTHPKACRLKTGEVAEASIHSLNAKHGNKLGKCPTGRIYTDAKWRARDMRPGGYRTRVGLDVELRDHELASLTEPYNFDKAVADSEFIDRLEQGLQERGEADVLG